MRRGYFEISEEAFQLLLSIEKQGYAEYRDNYETIEEFKESSSFMEGIRTLESFLARNHNGTYHLINGLLENGLVETSEDSWHATYILTKRGKDFINQQKQ